MKKNFVTGMLGCILLIGQEALAQGSGKSLVGVFDGRTPCMELAGMLNEKKAPDCSKIKWRLTLYKDAVTGKPDTYELIGLMRQRNDPMKGNWHILKGTKSDPNAVVYQLDLPGKPSMWLLKADENILFFLDAEKNLMVGNKDYSYTLNRK